jgi:hypothetical protein
MYCRVKTPFSIEELRANVEMLLKEGKKPVRPGQSIDACFFQPYCSQNSKDLMRRPQADVDNTISCGRRKFIPLGFESFGGFSLNSKIFVDFIFTESNGV